MEITGKIKTIGATLTFGAKEFKKRELVITTDETYPQFINVEFTQDKCELVDKFKVGDDVKIHINIRGREWINPEGVAKYFNSINGWRIESAAAAEQAPPASDIATPPLVPEAENDVPF